ncbi:MAG: enoyl-CoA hydratase/isomerase family protein [Alphaproteobacteria bacterium]|nr:enoyl-CoA hydratase/isomerase family protein [Alphaproteobacteria bacterium]
MAGRIDSNFTGVGVLTLWIDNLDHLNALNNGLIDALANAISGAKDREGCRAIVIRGRGGIFCAGRELRDLRAIADADIEVITATYHKLRLLNEALYLTPIPTICVVEKYGFGAGATLSSWCDISIAERDALMAFPEVHHGIVPSPAMMALLRGVPRKAIMELVLTGRRIDGDEAARINLITRAVDKAEIEAELESILAGILRGSAGAIARTKEFIVHCEDASHRSAMISAVDSISIGLTAPETKARINAFLDGQR